MTRKYSSISVETTLASGISNSATTMTVAAGTGSALMGGVTLAAGNVDIFTVALDVDTQNEEVVYITQVSSDTFTIVRARAGTSAIAHTGGATVKHVLTSDDLNFYTAGVATADAAVPESIVTAKADLLVASASGVVDNLAVGTNNQVLTADSTATLGVKWATPSDASLIFNAQTGTTYSLVAGDVNKLVTLSNAGTITLTVPNGVFTTGQQINIQQLGAGTVQIRNDGTTVLTSTGATSTAPNLRAQFSAATIICTSSNNFTVIGDLA
jgi:trimeric autotransporter adhesin